MKLFAPICFLLISFSGLSQDDPLIRQTVDDLFLSMRTGDSILARGCFHKDAGLKSCFASENGKTLVLKESAAALITAIGMPRKEVWDERIHDVEIRIDGCLAMAWAPYTFYLDGEYQHEGVNLFELVKTDGKWLILSITDTRWKNEQLLNYR
jgi:hypothetical protein